MEKDEKLLEKNANRNDKKKTEKVRKPKDEKNIHEGHRARLVDFAYKANLDALNDIQIMECFLTYIFPRGDVNPLAHRLLDKFETFNHVIEASVEDLKSVRGINDRSAKMIHLFCEFFYYYTSLRTGKKYKVTSRNELYDIVEDFLRLRTTEHLLLLAISPAHYITHKRLINMQDASEVGISSLELTNFITSSKASSLVIAHCHPYGRALPSPADNESFEVIKKLCESCGVNFVDSLIIGEDGIYSQNDKEYVRDFGDISSLKNFVI